METGIIRYSFNSIRHYLTGNQQRKGLWMFILLLIASFLDVIGLASLVPVMLITAEPGGVQKNKYIFLIYQILDFKSEKKFLIFLIVSVFLFFLLKNIFSSWVSYIQARFTAEVGLDIVESQLQKYMYFPFWYFNDFGSAKLINTTLEVPRNYVATIIRPLFVFFSEVAVVAVIVIGILLYKPVLLIILMLVLVPTTLLTYRALRSRSQVLGNRMNELRPVSFSILSDLFNGFAELKLANKQIQFRNRLLVNQKELQTVDSEAYLYTLLPIKIIEMVAILGVLTIFMYSILLPSESGGIITLVGLFAAAAYRLMPSVNRMLTAMMQLKQGQYTIEVLESYREDIYNEAPHPYQLPLEFNDKLVFDNLTFSFPNAERPALRGINITIRKGEKIGFIGSSGSGKTTLMNVLLRFYTEQEGQLIVDEQPLTCQYIQSWHSIIGYVKQDTFLMEASIQDNITLGDSVVDKKRLEYAIEQASLSSFIASLPNGVNTSIGERGSKLSGGQRQRIGIARALYKETQIIMLDEATSALDNETEREVNEAINKLSQTDITILIIAHRITTLRECNRIYEMSQGRIVAEHQYESLVRQLIQP